MRYSPYGLKTHYCQKCKAKRLAQVCYEDEDGKRYKVYVCITCDNEVRIFVEKVGG